MDNKPMASAIYTKGEEEIWFCGDNSAAFSGPNREANARKFAHVDELVEALELSRETLSEWIDYIPTWAREKHGMDAEIAKLDAVLAKIRGGQ